MKSKRNRGRIVKTKKKQNKTIGEFRQDKGKSHAICWVNIVKCELYLARFLRSYSICYFVFSAWNRCGYGKQAPTHKPYHTKRTRMITCVCRFFMCVEITMNFLEGQSSIYYFYWFGLMPFFMCVCVYV